MLLILLFDNLPHALKIFVLKGDSHIARACCSVPVRYSATCSEPLCSTKTTYFFSGYRSLSLTTLHMF